MSKAIKDYLNNKYGTQHGYGGLHNPSKYYDPKKLKPNKVMKFKLHEHNYAKNMIQRQKRGKR